MLYLDEPIGPINGLMVYRDHSDRDLFFYVPERPRLARNNGVPEFVFLKYRRDITDNPDFDADTQESLGGGFMAFTVDLGVDDEELDAVKQELASFAEGEVKLAPIQFRKGSVRLSISKDTADAPDAAEGEPRGLTFFEEVYGASKPSLFGFNRATFSLVLSQEAATLFEAALRSGISPIGVIYDLEFLGLRPAFHVRITAEYKRVYDHLEAEFGARGQIQAVSLAADIGVAFQKLRDEGAIKVEVLNFTDDEDLRNQADSAFEWFKTELLEEFFESALEPPSFMNRTASEGMLGQLQNLFGGLTSVQSGSTPRPQRGTPTPAPPTAAEPATDLSGAENDTSEINREAASTGAAASSRPAGGDNNLAPFQIAFSLKYYRQEELKKRSFDYSMQAAVARESAPQGLFSTIIEGLDLSRAIVEVDLDDDFFKRLVSSVSMGGDLEASGVATVAVNLEYPGVRDPGAEPTHVDGFLFTPADLESKTFTTWLNESMDLIYRYQMDIHFKPDSPWVGKEAHVTSDWETTRDRVLTLDPMDEVGLMDVEISLGDVDSEEVTQAQVEMRYTDDANAFNTEETFVLKPGEPGAHWRLRLSDPNLRTYEYRTTYFLKDSIRVETDWASSGDPSLVVNEPFLGELNVRLVPILSADDIIEAVVDVTYREEETGYTRRSQTVFTPPEIRSVPISIPTLAEDPAQYTYEVTVIRVDGSVFESGPQTSGDSVALISDGHGSTHRIKIRVVGTQLAEAGLAALKVNLVGPGADPDRDSVLFTPSQNSERTVALVQPDEGGQFTYSYEVSGYTLTGQPIAGDSGETTDNVLLVRAPSTT